MQTPEVFVKMLFLEKDGVLTTRTEHVPTPFYFDSLEALKTKGPEGINFGTYQAPSRRLLNIELVGGRA